MYTVLTLLFYLNLFYFIGFYLTREKSHSEICISFAGEPWPSKAVNSYRQIKHTSQIRDETYKINLVLFSFFLFKDQGISPFLILGDQISADCTSCKWNLSF